MTNFENNGINSSVALATPFTESVGTGVATLPSVTWQGDHYEATCCAFTLAGRNYTSYAGPIIPPDSKYCCYADASDSKVIGSPTALYNAEPADIRDVSGIDGDSDLNALLVVGNLGGNQYAFSLIYPHAEGEAVIAGGVEMGFTADAEVFSIFRKHGAGVSYEFDASALPEGVTLWGGDGAGGDRTTGGGVFPAGETLLTFSPASEVRLLGVRCVFEPRGGDRALACMLKVNGADVYPVPVRGGGECETPVAGKVTCAAGDIITLEVVRDNNGGGRVCASLIYKEA